MDICHDVAGLKFLSCKSDVEEKRAGVVVIEKETCDSNYKQNLCMCVFADTRNQVMLTESSVIQFL